MFLNGYSVNIPEGQENSQGYVVLRHGQKYHLVLRNTKRTRCNVTVEIDGKNQGTWRLPAREVVILERPAHDDGCFTFYKLGSSEGNTIGLSPDDSKLGLVKITFVPEFERPIEKSPEVYYERGGSKGWGQSYGIERSANTRGMSAGGTGLSGQSHQSFGRAEEIDLDESQTVIINLRLVANDDSDKPRPLTNYSNPVPPPVH